MDAGAKESSALVKQGENTATFILLGRRCEGCRRMHFHPDLKADLTMSGMGHCRLDNELFS